MNAPPEPAELLAPSPAVLTDIRIGYARVSTGGQKLDQQYDALKACHAFLTPGDTLVVPSLDRAAEVGDRTPGSTPQGFEPPPAP